MFDLYAPIFASAIADRIFPGAVLLVARGDCVEHHAAYGTTMYEDAGSQPVQPDTIYDIASLTKMVTATAALRLVAAGALTFDTSVQQLVPSVTSAAITVRHLLTHSSGLDVRLSVLRANPPAALLAAAGASPLAHPPGTIVAYSNINTLLLGVIVERICQAPLAAALDELVLAPLGMMQTCFNPPVAWYSRIAPTEYDADWRARLVHGTVHDESTHALGGAAGHAGLFSTTSDLWCFCSAWRLARHGAGPMAGWLPAAFARQATVNQTPWATLASGYGWMLDRPFMGTVPPGSYGHTGFTGPVMLSIPAHDLTVIILSNRTYPQRGPIMHHRVTAAVTETTLSPLSWQERGLGGEVGS